MSIGDIAVQVKDPKAPELVPHKYCMTVSVSSIFSPLSFFLSAICTVTFDGWLL